MQRKQIKNYQDFVDELLAVGFSMGGGNSEKVYAVVPWNWEQTPPYKTPVCWHTGDPETDPWEWRMRVLDERGDIAYAKMFFKKSGYITKVWYPHFLAVRRHGLTFEEQYEDGLISHEAKRIYTLILEYGTLPLHAIKLLAGFGKEEKSAFDRALVELQMKLYITMCGRQQKLSKKGEEYGWSSTVFCTTERFFGDSVFEAAAKLEAKMASEELTEQIYRINPEADPKKVKKFILG